MMMRIIGDRVESVTREEVEAMCRDLLKAADALNSVRDDAEKVAACMEVFRRRTPQMLEATRNLSVF
jgi:hypothetical protein